MKRTKKRIKCISPQILFKKINTQRERISDLLRKHASKIFKENQTHSNNIFPIGEEIFRERGRAFLKDLKQILL